MPNHDSIDQNDHSTWTAYNETTGTVETLYTDPTTEALLCFGVAPDANTPTALNNAKIDENDNPTLLGYNETSGQIEAIRCGTDGSLLVKIVP